MDGFAFTGFEVFKPGTSIMLELPHLDARQATVVWDDGLRTGCQFAEPLTEAELDGVISHY